MTLYFNLSPTTWDKTSGSGPLSLTLELDVDGSPAEATVALGAAKAAATGPEGSDSETITIAGPETKTAVLKLTDSESETVTAVLTVSGTPDRKEPFTVEATLTADSGLTIESKTSDVSVLAKSLAVACQLAPEGDERRRCQALLEDETQCPLRRSDTGSPWYPRHTEHHTLLHHELLPALKNEHATVNPSILREDATAAVRGFNAVQQTLALRVLITSSLWAGDENAGHRDIRYHFATLRGGTYNFYLEQYHCDHLSARVPIRQYINDFSRQADKREMRPKGAAYSCSQAQLNLREVHKMLEALRTAPGAAQPSNGSDPGSTTITVTDGPVSRVFAEPATAEDKDGHSLSELYITMLVRFVQRMGDLEAPVYQCSMEPLDPIDDHDWEDNRAPELSDEERAERYWVDWVEGSELDDDADSELEDRTSSRASGGMLQVLTRDLVARFAGWLRLRIWN